MYDSSIEKLKKQIDMEKLPNHIAIIMDGNGRWAQKRMLPRSAGHKMGVEKVKEIIEVVGKLGIKYLTLYTLSTENWKRPKYEIDTLMNLLVQYLRKELDNMNKNNIKINILGDIDIFPNLPKKEVLNAVEKTKNNNKLILNIALNYGGRNEIVSAVRKILYDVKNKNIELEDIDEESFKNYLYTCNQPDPDLLIRPSGELRLSNFLLYQIAYTEFWFSDIYWPDFSEKDLYRAIVDFQKRERRYGGI